MFLNQLDEPGRDFCELGGVSGADDIGDTRSFSRLDYNRDGAPDLALANLNRPVTRLLRNEIAPDKLGGYVAIRLEGGNRQAATSSEWSTRDACGARIEIERSDDVLLVREHRCDEGFAGQNSSTVIVGLGEHDAHSLTVTWPSGKQQRSISVSAGDLVTVYENPEHAPTGDAFVHTRYAVPLPASPRRAKANDLGSPPLPGAVVQELTRGARLTLLTTMATWCIACQHDVPQLELLLERFSDSELNIVGLPIEPTDDDAKLAAWVEQFQPPYELVTELTADERTAVMASVAELTGYDAVPATFLVDEHGTLIAVQLGVPTVSDIRRHLGIKP